jgi:hypothetical protein
MPEYQSPSARYRELALEALELANTFPPGEQREAFLQMAQVWQRLAETYADSTVLHIPSGGSDQPGVQQQQQDQPDDDKKD